MEHRNPLLNTETNHKFITIGEIMLRLTSPNYEKIRMTSSFSILDRVGGGDANITDDAATILNLMNMNYDIRR